jgi:predicted ABC-type ATPase
MLERLHVLADRRSDFAFETTLAGRAYAHWIRRLRSRRYDFHLMYLWLRDVDVAVKRVRRRVELGCHDVPEATIRRRYEGGLANFFTIYRPLAKTWHFYDNSTEEEPVLIAEGAGKRTRTIHDHEGWLAGGA